VTGLRNWLPEGLDLDRPSGARVYDYLLDGGHNFAHDRELAERVLAAMPNAREVARLNRAFLRNVVLHMMERGIRQFLDLGSGIPTIGNVHEIAQKFDPQASVVYVDYEDVAVAHSELMLEGNRRATIVQADFTRPRDVLEHPSTQGLLDFTKPLGLLMVGVIHFVAPEQDPKSVVAQYRDAVAPGSHLGLSQFTTDLRLAEMTGVVEIMRSSRDPIHPRSRAEITALFDGFDLQEPGVVPTSQWPTPTDTDPTRAAILAGAAVRQ
jgi:hypothetical protein